MPTFLIEVEEFFRDMDEQDKQEMFDLLVEDGYTKQGYSPHQLLSIGEQYYIKALEKLESRYHALSKEEEETILKIANKF